MCESAVDIRMPVRRAPHRAWAPTALGSLSAMRSPTPAAPHTVTGHTQKHREAAVSPPPPLSWGASVSHPKPPSNPSPPPSLPCQCPGLVPHCWSLVPQATTLVSQPCNLSHRQEPFKDHTGHATPSLTPIRSVDLHCSWRKYSFLLTNLNWSGPFASYTGPSHVQDPPEPPQITG